MRASWRPRRSAWRAGDDGTYTASLAHQLALLIIHHLEEVFHALQREQILGSTAAELAWADRPDAIAYIVDFDPSIAAHGEAITYFRSNTYRLGVVRDG